MADNNALKAAWKKLREGQHPVVVEVMNEALETAQGIAERDRQTLIRDRIIEGLDKRISPDGEFDGTIAEELISRSDKPK